MSALSWLACLLASFVGLTSLVFAMEQAPTPSAPPDASAAEPERGSAVFQSMEVFSEPGDGQLDENRIITSTQSEEFAELDRRMRAQLADPTQRLALRAQHRSALESQHAELSQALDIDAATANKLLDLLADLHMRSLDRAHGERPDRSVDAHMSFLQAQADAQTEQTEAIRAIVGEEGLERYQYYTATLGERMLMNTLDSRLPAESKLQRAQKDRLIALLYEHTWQDLKRNAISRIPMLPTVESTSIEDMQLALKRQVITANEANLRRMPEADRQLAEQAARFLTPAQMEVWSQMNVEKMRNLRQSIERSRVRAGLSREIPDDDTPEAASTSPLRKAVSGDIKLEIQLTVNRHAPTLLTHAGANGVPITFQTAEGLWVEATPVLYDDQAFEVDLTFYEQGRTGRRRLQGGSSFGGFSTEDNGVTQGGNATVITGRKGYLINVTANTSAL